MSGNLDLHHLLFSKRMCVNVTRSLIVSLVILSSSAVITSRNADAPFPSYLTRLNNGDKLQTLQL